MLHCNTVADGRDTIEIRGCQGIECGKAWQRAPLQLEQARSITMTCRERARVQYTRVQVGSRDRMSYPSYVADGTGTVVESDLDGTCGNCSWSIHASVGLSRKDGSWVSVGPTLDDACPSLSQENENVAAV